MNLGHKSIYKQLDWADSLIECGSGKTVAAGMIEKIKEKLREAYKTGIRDGKAEVRTSKRIANGDIH